MRGELIMATGLTRQPSLLLLLVSSSLHSRPSENTIDIAELALLVVLVLICFINRTNHCYPVNTTHFYNICTMLDQRRRRWADVVKML